MKKNKEIDIKLILCAITIICATIGALLEEYSIVIVSMLLLTALITYEIMEKEK
jgi:hypothetical protein